jgi:hypothetical protein
MGSRVRNGIPIPVQPPTTRVIWDNVFGGVVFGVELKTSCWASTLQFEPCLSRFFWWWWWGGVGSHYVA